MPVTISGTTGITGPDGSASTPSLAGADSNTGVFFPAADTVAIATGGTEAVRVNSSQNVGIGTSSPGTLLHIAKALSSTQTSAIQIQNTGTFTWGIGIDNAVSNSSLVFQSGGAGGTTRAVLDSSGNLLVGTTNTDPTFNRVNGTNIRASGGILLRSASAGSDFGINVTSGTHFTFFTDNGSARVTAGNIASNGNVTSYNTGSDYRLKEDVAPMAGALSKIAALKPVTYKWIDNKAQGEGFLAHELAEVIPLAVTGGKDAVREDGSPDIQSVDYSKIVVHLVAAIQEQQALITSLTARIAALEGAAQ